jgi:GTP 3',8-cyclase
MQQELHDSFGRKFEYLRLSVTDVCNFRCIYCLPNGYQRPAQAEAPLSVKEIENLVSGFARFGFWKVRITGGEPTVRGDILEIVSRLSEVPGIRKVALSTNGYRLKWLAPSLKSAGINALNISLDSLDPKRLAQISGRSNLQKILEGIEVASSCGFDSIKLNAVLLRGMNDEDVDRFIEWVRDRPITVRFIELMQTRKNRELFEASHVSGGEVQFRLLRNGWTQKRRTGGDGPAVEYEHPSFLGRVGIIAPYSKEFCKTCNRLRVSSSGKFRLCLFGNSDYSLRPWLQSEDQWPELIERIQSLISTKANSHLLKQGQFGNTWNLAAIGG